MRRLMVGIIVGVAVIGIGLGLQLATVSNHTIGASALPMPSSTTVSTDQAAVMGVSTVAPSPSLTIRQVASTPTKVVVTPTGAALNYPSHTVTATYFYVGEPETAANDYITNVVSAWDNNWVSSYGGVDDPAHRNGLQPAAFVPKENPFYFALPYGDYNEKGPKANVTVIPWYHPFNEGVSLLKNRWVAISYNGKTAYAQWEDVGPNEDDDHAYVFGTAAPKNTFGEHAGIDISPATRDFLGTGGSATVTWHFVEDVSVPAGPWKTIVTTSAPNWK